MTTTTTPRGMSRAALQRLAEEELTTDLVTAGAAFGMGRSTAYALASRGEFPVEVLRLGRLLRVRTADLVRALGDYQPAA